MEIAEDVPMWNRLSIRVKLTLVTGAVLCIISLIYYLINIGNASTIFILPDNTNITEAAGENCFQIDMNVAQETFRINCFYITVFCSVVGTALMWYVSGKVLKPLDTFADTIKHLDINKINEDINVVKTKDEVGELQNAFNYMLQNMKESYIRQKSFSQNAAHELKTPVAAIKTNLEVLSMDDEPGVEDYKDFVNVVGRQVEMMSSIVQGLRLLSSGEELNLENVCLHTIVDEVMTDLRNDLKSKMQKISIDFDNDKFIVSADRVLLKQAIFNLMHNAIRYSNKEANIEIKLKDNIFSIKNYGVGIPKEDLEKIFDAFYCVDKSRSKKYGGSGLGLAITKEIMNKHKFEIRANSMKNDFVELLIDFKGENT